VQFLLSDQKTTYFTNIIAPDTKTTALLPNDEYIVQKEIFIGTLKFFTNEGSVSQKFRLRGVS
jgi:hypothetical protein